MSIKAITFSGVDGAGKTTILRAFKKILESNYGYKTVELRQRPSILPILSAVKYGRKKAELKTMDVLPRSGTNSSSISSYVRFFYYFIDYVFGQLVVYFKYTSKGVVIIYDRYYFDYIADPKRANIVIDPSIANFLYRFVFKPDVNVFLYASPETILERKQELSKEDIILLTSNYKNVFNEFSDKYDQKYISINNTDVDRTLNQIFNELDTSISD